MNCIQCRHWNELPVPSDTKVRTGRCRRYAPQKLHGVGSGYEKERWPRTEAHEVCGEIQCKYCNNTGIHRNEQPCLNCNISWEGKEANK